jgi:general secretion pathway protein G
MMTRHKKQGASAEDGFTLVELLVSLVIISILTAIALVSLLNALDRSKQRATMADLRTISRAVEAYQVDAGLIPSGTLAEITPLLIPYQINVVPQTDHWSNPMVYTSSADSYSIESYGKDGINGDNISKATRTDFTLDIVLSDGVFVAAPD